MIKRVLSVHFNRSVSSNGEPDEMEVVVVPLSTASSGTGDSTFTQFQEVRNVVLDTKKTVQFELIPSHEPSLDNPILYRIAWRKKYLGGIVSYDFAMPDADVDFDDLRNLGHIIGSEQYVLREDVGRPDGPAKLDIEGFVLDGDGNRIGVVSQEQLIGLIEDEAEARVAADATLTDNLTDLLSTGLQTQSESLIQLVNDTKATLEGADLSERNARTSAVNALQGLIDGLQSSVDSLTSTDTTHGQRLNQIEGGLPSKADLDSNNKVPLSQIPQRALTRVMNLSTDAGKLGLTDVHQGDIAVTPTGPYLLVGTDPALEESWVRLFFGTEGPVVAVNDKTGQVTLTAEDVDARPAGVPLSIAEVSGLGGQLYLKVDKTDPRLTDERPPVSHASTHGVNGNDRIRPSDINAVEVGEPIPMATITGLLESLGLKATIAQVTGLQSEVQTERERVDGLEDLTPRVKGSISYTALDPNDRESIVLNSPFGINPSGQVYFEAEGVTNGDGAWPYVDENGYLHVRRYDPDANPAPPLATKNDFEVLDALFTTLHRQKATRQELTEVIDVITTLTRGIYEDKVSVWDFDSYVEELGQRATLDDLNRIQEYLAHKADYSQLVEVDHKLLGKADLDLDGKILPAQFPDITADDIGGLESKADLDAGVLRESQIPMVPQDRVEGLDVSLAEKASLLDGKVPPEELPDRALDTAVSVATETEMLGLTGVQPGDVVVVTSDPVTSKVGTYQLVGSDPTQVSSWLKYVLLGENGGVASVNGKVGEVTLAPSDIGARSSTVPVPLEDVSNLVTLLDGKVDESELDTALLNRPAGSILSVQYVATTPPASLSGTQQIDGKTTVIGDRVLLVSQSSSVQNGVWVVSPGSWVRPDDLPRGTKLSSGVTAIVTDGLSQNNTIWQMVTENGSTIGMTAQNWSRVLIAGLPPKYLGSSTVNVSSDLVVSVKTSTGLRNTSGGVAIDPTYVVRKYASDLPGGSAITLVAHNLNTLDVTLALYEKSTGNSVLAGWSVRDVNTISIEFAEVPVSGQYRVVVTG